MYVYLFFVTRYDDSAVSNIDDCEYDSIYHCILCFHFCYIYCFFFIFLK